jgi:hypothetical protein
MPRENAKLGKYSIGMGDRFAHQAKAQLSACNAALDRGVEIIPVWNKSNREHIIIGSEPASARLAADAAVKALHWKQPYYLDADHICLQTVDRFLPACDFYTIDVADSIGKGSPKAEIDRFVAMHSDLLGTIWLKGVDEPLTITAEDLYRTAGKFLYAVKTAAEIYRRIETEKGKGNFIPEISMDETDVAQSPAQLLIILAAIADENTPIQIEALERGINGWIDRELVTARVNAQLEIVWQSEMLHSIGDRSHVGLEFTFELCEVVNVIHALIEAAAELRSNRAREGDLRWGIYPQG